MAKAKIYGFLYDTRAVMRKYTDDSNPSRYARAIAYHRSGSIDKAIALLDQLIPTAPQNPWFYELKGQIYFESGMPRAAIAPYRKAIALMPDEALLHLGLGVSALAIDQRNNHATKYTKMALSHLRTALRLDPQNATVYQQLSRAFGQAEDVGRAEWAAAEWYALIGNKAQAKQHAMRAIKRLPSNSTEYLRARDIMRVL